MKPIHFFFFIYLLSAILKFIDDLLTSRDLSTKLDHKWQQINKVASLTFECMLTTFDISKRSVLSWNFGDAVCNVQYPNLLR